MLISARSYEEYVAMFGLTTTDVHGSVLDCSAGAAAFVAGVNANGGNAMAVDPIYDQDADRLAYLARNGLADCLRMTQSKKDAFVWN